MNSLFTLGLVIGLTVQDTTFGTTVANLGMSETTFPKPVFAGDTIRAETEVTALRPSASRPGQGVVTFAHVGLNQRDEIVCRTLRAALMMARPA
jgi:acyl dehydratase